MAKIKLGSRPKSFKRTVSFPLVEGGTGQVVCDYRYRTRKDFGLFIDGLLAEAKIKVEPSEDGTLEFSMADLMKKTTGSNAAYLLEVLDGWNLDEELTLDNAQQFSDELPGGAAAIMEAYRAAVQDGRLGN